MTPLTRSCWCRWHTAHWAVLTVCTNAWHCGVVTHVSDCCAVGSGLSRWMRSSGPSLQAWSIVDIMPCGAFSFIHSFIRHLQLGEDPAFGMYHWTPLLDPDEKLRQLVKCDTLEACAFLLDDQSSCTVVTQTACQHWGLSAKYTLRAYEAKTGPRQASHLRAGCNCHCSLLTASYWTFQRFTSSPAREYTEDTALCDSVRLHCGCAPPALQPPQLHQAGSMEGAHAKAHGPVVQQQYPTRCLPHKSALSPRPPSSGTAQPAQRNQRRDKAAPARAAPAAARTGGADLLPPTFWHGYTTCQPLRPGSACLGTPN